MLGTKIRSFRHMKRCVGNNERNNVIVCDSCKPSCGYLYTTKGKNGNEITLLFQNCNGYRENGLKFFDENEREVIIELLHKYYYFTILDNSEFHTINQLFVLNNDFDSLYDNFLSNNKKLFSTLFSKYCSESNDFLKYFFCLIGNKPNLILWAVTNIYKNRIDFITICRVLIWNENYNKFSNKLSKGTITAYNTKSDINLLNCEIDVIRKEKRSNDSINMFNTFQKKMLKNVDLTPRLIDILNKFGRLSKEKKKNFVRKMSTVDNSEEIFKNMLFLTNSKFNWDKNSVVEYINNAENINAEIIKNYGDILLIKVNDYDTVKFLARATNWCISKNKRYWNDYIERNENAKQYVLYDFSKKEDDELSIIGFTIGYKNCVSHAHNFKNDNLMPSNNDIIGIDTFESFLPDKSSIDIYDILNSHNIKINDILGIQENSFTNKDSYLAFLNDKIGCDDYHILYEDNNNVIARFRNNNMQLLLGDDLNDILYEYGFKTTCDIIIFQSFNEPIYKSNKLIWCPIKNNDKLIEECPILFSENNSILNVSFDMIITKYNLPYNIISRIGSDNKVWFNAINNNDFNTIRYFLENKKDFILEFKGDKKNNSQIFYRCIINSIFSAYSFDLILAIYNNGYKLNDLLDDYDVSSLIRQIFSRLTTLYYDYNRYFPTNENDYNLFINKELPLRKAKIIGLVELFKIICENEENTQYFEPIFVEIEFDDSEYFKHIYKLLINKINFKKSKPYANFINKLCSLNLIDDMEYILKNSSNREIKKIINSYITKNEFINCF